MTVGAAGLESAKMMIAQISDTHVLARSSDQAVAGPRADNLRRCIPVGTRETDRHRLTVQELADRYLRVHAATKKRASSARSDASNLRLHVVPSLGKLAVEEVTRAEPHDAGSAALQTWFLSGCLNGAYELQRVCPNLGHHLEELDDIKAPLAVFVLRNIGLRLTQSDREFGLS